VINTQKVGNNLQVNTREGKLIVKAVNRKNNPFPFWSSGQGGF